MEYVISGSILAGLVVAVVMQFRKDKSPAVELNLRQISLPPEARQFDSPSQAFDHFFPRPVVSPELAEFETERPTAVVAVTEDPEDPLSLFLPEKAAQ